MTTVRLVPTPPQAELSSGLAPIDFADCYHGRSPRKGLTARQVADAMFARPSPIASGLMAVRNRIVGVFGLKTTAQGTGQETVGIFPLVSQTPGEMVLGLDDKHLDFRIWLSVREDEGGTDIWMSTLIRFNGLSGRAYLFVVMPFHKVLSRQMLGRGIAHLGR